jgi:hypothetical protein
MWNLNRVTNILYKGNYKYYIEFDNGVSGIIDFIGIWEKGPVFRCLEDENIFKDATIDGGTICWNNEIDLAPESLYEKISP